MTDVAPFAVVQAASIVVILVLAGLYVTAPEDPHTNGLVDIRFKDPPGSGSGPGNNTTDPPDNLPPVVEAGDPVSTLAGRVTVLEGIAIDQDGRIALYEWDFDGDGEFDWSNATSGKGQWTYARTGGYTAVLRVTDDEGAHGEDTVRVSVLSPPGNLEPIAYAGEDRVVEQGEEVEFYMTGNDFDGTLVLFEWDYDGDGTYDDNSTLVRITYHTYQVPGNYTALLRVTDDQGATSVDTRTIIVTERAVNLPPVVDAGPDVEVEIGEKVQLAGTAYDPDGVVEEYWWDLDGNGEFDWSSTISGVTETVYSQPGTYTPLLLVVDDGGETASDTLVVTVKPPRVNQPPLADAGHDGVLQVAVNETVQFSGTGTDPDGLVVMYEWDFDGDGAWDWTDTRESFATWVYVEEGTYTALFRVTDNEGAQDTDELTVEVTLDDPGDRFWPSNGKISIGSLGTWTFDPNKVETVRPDIFTENHFSLFDILVHLDSEGEIDLEYHFDASMNTHVIDRINGIGNWWYWAYYHMGWQETNNFRMDHYPYKDKMTIHVFREDPSRIDRIHGVFKEEVERREANDGKVIIPKVIIRGRTKTLTFTDVEVTAHNLRNDTFQEGVITAIDVILSLSEQGKITHKLTWYETIGHAEVLNWFVDGINNDIAYGTCGFVYEEGSEKLRYGNHIHIPSDYRVLNSPDYEEWFWICL